MKNFSKLFAFVVIFAALSLVIFAAPGLVDVSDSAEEVISSEPMEIFSDNVLQNGTEANPYLISSAVEFNKYANYVNNSNSTYGKLCYKLTSNIDFSSVQLVPFGTTGAPFKGTLDGNGYALLNVSIPDKVYSGVVGYMTMGNVKNLRVEYADILTRKSYSNIKYFGGILGYGVLASGKTITISGCRTSGSATMDFPGAVYAAGVVGYLDSKSGNASISDCLTDMSFDVTTEKNGYLAGFISHMSNGSTGKNCTVKNCVSLGNVSFVTTGDDATVGSFGAYTQKDEEGYSGWASEDDAYLAAENVIHFENCVSLGNVYADSQKSAKAGVFYAGKAGEGVFVMSNCYSSTEQTVEAVSSVPVISGFYGTKLAGENFRTAEFYSDTLGLDLDNKWYLTASGSLCPRTVAKSYGAAVIDNNRDVRLGARPGIRFRSEIESEKRDYCFEYGIIVASKENLGENELTLDFEGNKAVGVAYGEDVDKFISKDDESIVFSAVVINIKEENYASEIVARTYVKYVCDGKTVVAYGTPVTTSLSASAFEVRFSESFDHLTDEEKNLIESMIR